MTVVRGGCALPAGAFYIRKPAKHGKLVLG